MKTLVGLLLALWFASAATAANTLDVYTIDVEGGKSVLIVSPSGESMLYDLGWPGNNGRDSDRIVEVAKAAGLKAIDILVISHYDIDHMGDVPLLLSKIPVRRIIDHGPMQFPERSRQYKPYVEASEKLPHTVVAAGDKIPLKGVDIQVVAAATKFITKPVNGGGAANALCATNTQEAERPTDTEDNASIGLLFTLGKFRMVDLADLESHYDYSLMCPNNLLGSVDVYQVSIHGQDKGVSPVLAQALGARVAIMGNGPRKGGAPKSWQTLKGAKGLEDIWQVHYSELGTKETNPPEDFVANPEVACQAKWIKLSASPDGSFTVTNSRNGFTKKYAAR